MLYNNIIYVISNMVDIARTPPPHNIFGLGTKPSLWALLKIIINFETYF